MPLEPIEGEMFGRDDFLIHGDAVASTGCIVLPPDVRRMIADSGDEILQVIA